MIKEVSQTEKTNVDLHEVSTTVKHRDKAGERREVYHGPEGWGGAELPLNVSMTPGVSM